MIPKIIHCFWEGKKTKLAEKCLASWRRFCPGWEIREWGLKDLAEVAARSPFLAEAIRLRRWGAVSDYARMWALARFGGVYFDFDVELLRGIDDLLGEEWFAEERHRCAGRQIAPGLGMALRPGSPIAERMLELYDERGFDPKADMMTVIVTNLKDSIARSPVAPRVYPPDWFCPIDPQGKLHVTAETRSIHWFAMGWAGPKRRILRWLSWHGLQSLVDLAVRVKR